MSTVTITDASEIAVLAKSTTRSDVRHLAGWRIERGFRLNRVFVTAQPPDSDEVCFVEFDTADIEASTAFGLAEYGDFGGDDEDEGDKGADA